MQSAEAMFNHVFRNFGLPEDIVSDRGPQFTSRVWGSLCAWLGIGVSLSSGYHPQSNGQAEHLNQEIGRFLRTYCSSEQQRWMRAGISAISVPLIGGALRRPGGGGVVPAESGGLGAGPRMTAKGSKEAEDPGRPASPKFVGPFEIIRQVNPVPYRLRLPASYRICPTFHVSLLKPAHPSAGGSMACEEPPLPLDIEGSPAYQVRALLDCRLVQSHLQYLVDWEGYGLEERLWVDTTDILDPSIAEDFHRDHLNKPAPLLRGGRRLTTVGGGDSRILFFFLFCYGSRSTPVPVGGVAPPSGFPWGTPPHFRWWRRLPDSVFCSSPRSASVFVGEPRSTLWFSMGDATSTLVGGGGHRLYLSPAIPPLGGVSSSSGTDVITWRYQSSVDFTRRDCSAVDVAQHCCSAVDVARLCCSAVDVARLCCSAVDVARLCCSAVDIAQRLRSVVDVAWDPLALPNCFIQVRVIVDQEYFPGTQGQESSEELDL
ncbi:hypothetical protein QTP70_007081 [Hemibagrus guttatus]|uniref:Uncharacterized protein n=1 Tax=Hemibagrus guttatus TaxID=175788 RepID=A0AAE0VF71_9TELE|nr:hypothetical protein QTP70_007081 [Hemibagrus guttatus]KAK3574313.1 hypothetical protein QTP86_004342 [Hemibagrus guttatus]